MLDHGQAPRHWRAPDESGSLEPRLSYYPPGLRQPMHRHHRSHVSILIAGSFVEDSGSGDALRMHGLAIFRAEGTRHEVRFGPSGAVILSMNLPVEAAPEWPPSGVIHVGLPAGPGGLSAPAWGADCKTALQSGPRSLPAWLGDASKQLIETPRITQVSTLARGFGLHPAHFSRSFVRHFGLTPSAFRRRAMTAHALTAVLADGECLAGAAAAAGFVDQSHMSRAVVEACGMTPGHLRRVFGPEAISIQSTGELRR